jgi:hypothetical protein
VLRKLYIFTLAIKGSITTSIIVLPVMCSLNEVLKENDGGGEFQYDIFDTL